jgi:ABC-type transport system involved in cytochrome c biogenesis permease subunit
MASGGRPEVVHAKISVNHPMRWRGWWIYQNSYDAARESYTVLEAVRDPFLPMAAIAGALLLAGAALLCRWGRADQGPSRPLAGRPLASALKFAAATAVVMLPLWITGRAVLAKELVPALQSPLLVPHVGAYVVSYAILIFAAFGIGVRLVPFGFFLMTLALVLGAVWGKICWGDWWQYDPKEMWSLATWLTFAAYFHFRRHPAVARWLLRFGALMIILTLTWVNFARIFKGLHSYV